MKSNLFIFDICQKVLLGWLAKVDLTTQILRPDVVRENVVVDVVVDVVPPHIVGEDVGGNEGVCGGGVWHDESRASRDGNTAVEGGLGVGVEHLGVGGLDDGVVGGGDGDGGRDGGDDRGALQGSDGRGGTGLIRPGVVGEPCRWREILAGGAETSIHVTPASSRAVDGAAVALQIKLSDSKSQKYAVAEVKSTKDTKVQRCKSTKKLPGRHRQSLRM